MVAASVSISEGFKVRELLSTNTKLEKPVSGGLPYLVRGLSMAPANHSGYEVCKYRGACADACVLWFAGRTVTRSVRAAAIERTRLFFEDRPGFIAKLCEEITKAGDKAWRDGAQLAIRFNTASDLPFERIAPAIFEAVDSVGGVAYDYTKYPYDKRPDLPECYHLTHSISEDTTLSDIRGAIDRGRNVALVVNAPYNANGRHRKYGYIPERVRFATGSECITLETVDGDSIGDVRTPETDGRGKVVVLRGKGGRARVAEAVTGGFIRSLSWERTRGGGSYLEFSGWDSEFSGAHTDRLPLDNSMRRGGCLDLEVSA